MLPREEKYIHDWETKRSKSKWSYVFLTALVWGTIFPVLILSFRLALKGDLSLAALQDGIFTPAFLSIWVKFVGGFFLFALLMWRLALKKYRELKRKQAAQQQLRLPH